MHFIDLVLEYLLYCKITQLYLTHHLIYAILLFNFRSLQILMGVFRLEFLTSYFSEQVMSGFVVGAYVHVFFAQIGDILGIKLKGPAGPGYLYFVSMAILIN
jgi:MFS superfamily sulfate permease-like transporter